MNAIRGVPSTGGLYAVSRKDADLCTPGTPFPSPPPINGAVVSRLLKSLLTSSLDDGVHADSYVFHPRVQKYSLI